MLITNSPTKLDSIPFQTSKNNSAIVDYVAGVCGGIAVVFVGHPFDTCKTRLQTAPNGFYSNTIDCVQKTFNQEGFRGFYSGVFSPLYGQMFFRAASFATFRFMINTLSVDDSPPAASKLMFAGAFTGLCISFIETPIDLVKTKLQTQIFAAKLNPGQKPDFSTVRECVKYLVERNGVRALWQGLVPTVIRNIPANAVFFPVNELVKREFATKRGCNVNELQVHHRLIAGACAGLSYWIGTYPLDAIKAHVQSR